MARMPRYLFIVARGHPELCAHLEREFVAEEGVEVVLDRRRAERRKLHAASRDGERRRAERRAHPPIQHELNTLNFALVRAE
jgi:hypothetical protein